MIMHPLKILISAWTSSLLSCLVCGEEKFEELMVPFRLPFLFLVDSYLLTLDFSSAIHQLTSPLLIIANSPLLITTRSLLDPITNRRVAQSFQPPPLKRLLRPSAIKELDDEPFQSTKPISNNPARHLRSRNIPYAYDPTKEMQFEGLDHKSPLGIQKLLATPLAVVEFEEVRYAGGYNWYMPLMRDELGRVDDRVPGERVFTTPGESPDSSFAPSLECEAMKHGE
jgi:hypothetical protein